MQLPWSADELTNGITDAITDEPDFLSQLPVFRIGPPDVTTVRGLARPDQRGSLGRIDLEHTAADLIFLD